MTAPRNVRGLADDCLAAAREAERMSRGRAGDVSPLVSLSSRLAAIADGGPENHPRLTELADACARWAGRRPRTAAELSATLREVSGAVAAPGGRGHWIWRWCADLHEALSEAEAREGLRESAAAGGHGPFEA